MPGERKPCGATSSLGRFRAHEEFPLEEWYLEERDYQRELPVAGVTRGSLALRHRGAELRA